MRIDFSAISDTKYDAGSGSITARISEYGRGKVIPCRIHPGGSTGMHRHDDGDSISYVLYGTGEAVCGGNTEQLVTDICHICPKGCEHMITNTGNTDLVMLTVITEG